MVLARGALSDPAVHQKGVDAFSRTNIDPPPSESDQRYVDMFVYVDIERFLQSFVYFHLRISTSWLYEALRNGNILEAVVNTRLVNWLFRASLWRPFPPSHLVIPWSFL